MKYPIGIQTFADIINDGFVYVDKTAYVYKLASEGKYYFLSRPRRFGKSLLISTMHSYFDGRKDLFEGLEIAKLEKDWKKYPVLHLDLNTGKFTNLESLTDILNENLVQWERIYGVDDSEKDYGRRFQGVIRRASQQLGEKVAILVDEYDKPLLQALGNEPLQDEFRTTLKAFYGALKSADQYIKFAFLTGVTKFSKVSIFSDLNNLIDISMLPQYAGICGISETELPKFFDESVAALATTNNITKTQCYQRLKKEYDGYHFCPDSEGMYNPFSLLNTLAFGKFGHYWFSTGTPTFLVELLKRNNCNIQETVNMEVTSDMLDSVDSLFSNPVPVMYQSGYLTIKEYDPRFRSYTLGFPNLEVEEGFMKFLLPSYSPFRNSDNNFHIVQFVKEIESGKTESFVNRLRSFFADTPYELVKDLENHYQNVLYIISKLIGFYVQAEYRTSNGRIDMVLQTDKYTYILEFKIDKSAQEALKQIQDKNYTLPFEVGDRQIIRIGFNFNTKTRNIDQFVVE